MTPLPVAVILDQSGPFAGVGDAVAQGLKTGCGRLVGTLASVGIKAELQFLDDRCDPERAAAVAHKICQQGQIIAIGHLCSDATAAALPIYQARRTLLLCPTATSSSLSFNGADGLFRICASDVAQAKAVADLATSQFADWPWLLIEETGVVGESQARAYRHHMRQAPIAAVSADAAFDTLERLSSYDRALVLYAGHESRCIKTILAEMNRTRPSWLMMACEAGGHAELAEPLKKQLRFATIQLPASFDASLDERATGLPRQNALRYFALGQATIEVLVGAVMRIRSTSVPELKRALLNHSAKTILGDLRFDADGETHGHRFTVERPQ